VEYMRLRILHFSLLICSTAFLQGCANLNTYHPLPQNLENQVQIAGFPDIRAWGDVPSTVLKKSAIDSLKQEMAANHGKLSTEVNILALSGGGSDGAFGAGALCGWTKAGTRPQFKLVTGISTGSLIAPFAFLGPAYDARLKEAYTTISDADIYKQNSFFSLILSALRIKPTTSLADNKPEAKLIARMIDADMLRKIAAEHLKGRRLLMGTTQLNAQRLVIWDMGAIATRGTPQALALFQKIMLASSSLPATFPPQYFDVVAQGKKYTEMHVDGGVEAQVMLFENAFVPFSKTGVLLNGHKRIRNLYIIRNMKIGPEWQFVKPQLRYIAIRSIDTLTKVQGIGDLYRLYVYALRSESHYNLAYIPDSFDVVAKSEFDKDYMNKLFRVGFNMAKSNNIWHAYPPLLTVD
jgi:hypothetical protein